METSTYQIINYSEKAIALVGDTKPIKDQLKAIGGRFNPRLTCGAGWIFSAKVREQLEALLNGGEVSVPAAKPQVNKYGVKVGDIFEASWGYEQTNVNFFQVVALVGESSVRVREVCLKPIDCDPTCSMAANYTYELPQGEILPAKERSTWINDQEKGDLKRLKSWAADKVSNPLFSLADYADAHLCTGKEVKCYESWYA